MQLKVLSIAAAVVLAGAVQAHAGILLSDTFSYPDGDLATVSGGKWVIHSGTTPLNVTGGTLTVTGANSEDQHADLAGAPISSGMLYAGFDVTLTALPTGTTYFAHFYNSSTTFRGKLFATTSGAATNLFKFAISNNASSVPSIASPDLSPDTTYHVVLALNPTDATTGVVTTLYIDAASETGGLTATDGTTSIGINSFAFRQASGEGTMTVDNLVVATTFAEANGSAVPEPASLGLLVLGGLALLRRR